MKIMSDSAPIEELKPYQIEMIKKWENERYACPVRHASEDFVFCGIDGYHPYGSVSCEYETCFARFVKRISG